jgi:hypothetical protein
MTMDETGQMTSLRAAVRAGPSGRAFRESLHCLVVLSICAYCLTGCAAQKRKPIVPEENQRKSEEMYGEQQQSMQSLNQTPAEQAAAAHESATRPPRDPGRED